MKKKAAAPKMKKKSAMTMKKKSAMKITEKQKTLPLNLQKEIIKSANEKSFSR